MKAVAKNNRKYITTTVVKTSETVIKKDSEDRKVERYLKNWAKKEGRIINNNIKKKEPEVITKSLDLLKAYGELHRFQKTQKHLKRRKIIAEKKVLNISGPYISVPRITSSELVKEEPDQIIYV